MSITPWLPPFLDSAAEWDQLAFWWSPGSHWEGERAVCWDSQESPSGMMPERGFLKAESLEFGASAHFGSTGWLGMRLWSRVPSLLASGQGSLKLMKPRWPWQQFLIKRSSSQGTPWSVLPLTPHHQAPVWTVSSLSANVPWIATRGSLVP